MPLGLFQRIAVIGAGKMGESLIGGLLEARLVQPARVTATARHQERLDLLESRFRVKTSLRNEKAARGASLIILAVKPQAMVDVLKSLRGRVRPSQIVVSVAASVT